MKDFAAVNAAIQKIVPSINTGALSRAFAAFTGARSSALAAISSYSALYAQNQLLKYAEDGTITDETTPERESVAQSVLSGVIASIEAFLLDYKAAIRDVAEGNIVQSLEIGGSELFACHKSVLYSVGHTAATDMYNLIFHSSHGSTLTVTLPTASQSVYAVSTVGDTIGGLYLPIRDNPAGGVIGFNAGRGIVVPRGDNNFARISVNPQVVGNGLKIDFGVSVLPSASITPADLDILLSYASFPHLVRGTDYFWWIRSVTSMKGVTIDQSADLDNLLSALRAL